MAGNELRSLRYTHLYVWMFGLVAVCVPSLTARIANFHFGFVIIIYVRSANGHFDVVGCARARWRVLGQNLNRCTILIPPGMLSATLTARMLVAGYGASKVR